MPKEISDKLDAQPAGGNSGLDASQYQVGAQDGAGSALGKQDDPAVFENIPDPFETAPESAYMKNLRESLKDMGPMRCPVNCKTE